jgi:hypothetical protein
LSKAPTPIVLSVTVTGAVCSELNFLEIIRFTGVAAMAAGVASLPVSGGLGTIIFGNSGDPPRTAGLRSCSLTTSMVSSDVGGSGDTGPNDPFIPKYTAVS